MNLSRICDSIPIESSDSEDEIMYDSISNEDIVLLIERFYKFENKELHNSEAQEQWQFTKTLNDLIDINLQCDDKNIKFNYTVREHWCAVGYNCDGQCGNFTSFVYTWNSPYMCICIHVEVSEI